MKPWCPVPDSSLSARSFSVATSSSLSLPSSLSLAPASLPTPQPSTLAILNLVILYHMAGRVRVSLIFFKQKKRKGKLDFFLQESLQNNSWYFKGSDWVTFQSLNCPMRRWMGNIDSCIPGKSIPGWGVESAPTKLHRLSMRFVMQGGKPQGTL